MNRNRFQPITRHRIRRQLKRLSNLSRNPCWNGDLSLSRSHSLWPQCTVPAMDRLPTSLRPLIRVPCQSTGQSAATVPTRSQHKFFHNQSWSTARQHTLKASATRQSMSRHPTTGYSPDVHLRCSALQDASAPHKLQIAPFRATSTAAPEQSLCTAQQALLVQQSDGQHLISVI